MKKSINKMLLVGVIIIVVAGGLLVSVNILMPALVDFYSQRVETRSEIDSKPQAPDEQTLSLIDQLTDRTTSLEKRFVWNISYTEKLNIIEHKKCGFNITMPDKWTLKQRDSLYLTRDDGLDIISGKEYPYMEFIITCSNTVDNGDFGESYTLPAGAWGSPKGTRSLSGNSTMKIQNISLNHNNRNYLIAIWIHYDYESLGGHLLTKGNSYTTYTTSEQQAIDAILRGFSYIE